MLKIATRFLVRLADRWMPDPLVVAIFLTFSCLLAAVLFTDFGVTESVDAWGISFWSLLAFTMQMVLILGLGHVVAHTKPVHRENSGWPNYAVAAGGERPFDYR